MDERLRSPICRESDVVEFIALNDVGRGQLALFSLRRIFRQTGAYIGPDGDIDGEYQVNRSTLLRRRANLVRRDIIPDETERALIAMDARSP